MLKWTTAGVYIFLKEVFSILLWGWSLLFQLTWAFFWKMRRLLLHISVKWRLCSRHIEFKELWPSAVACILQFFHWWIQLHCLRCYSATLSAAQNIPSLQQILSYKLWYNKWRRLFWKGCNIFHCFVFALQKSNF